MESVQRFAVMETIMRRLRNVSEDKLTDFVKFLDGVPTTQSMMTATEAMEAEMGLPVSAKYTRPTVAPKLPPPLYLKMFEEITSQMLDLTRRKNADYTGDAGDAFANFRIVHDLGLASVEVGILTRMSDKFSRIASLLQKQNLVKDESLEDTLFDLAVYAVILLIYRRHLIRQ